MNKLNLKEIPKGKIDTLLTLEDGKEQVLFVELDDYYGIPNHTYHNSNMGTVLIKSVLVNKFCDEYLYIVLLFNGDTSCFHPEYDENGNAHFYEFLTNLFEKSPYCEYSGKFYIEEHQNE